MPMHPLCRNLALMLAASAGCTGAALAEGLLAEASSSREALPAASPGPGTLSAHAPVPYLGLEPEPPRDAPPEGPDAEILPGAEAPARPSTPWYASPSVVLGNALLAAVEADDAAAVAALLAEGGDPNLELPSPAPDWLRERYAETPMAYYLQREPGVTLLMLAAFRGNPDVVEALMAAGAEPYRLTRRHKSFALQFAAKSQSTDAMQRLLGVGADSEVAELELRIDLAAQRGSLWRNGECIGTTRISTGRKGYETKKGRFVVTNKYRHWTSTIYNARMPYFMRLSCGDFGLHAGVVPGYPASHGCIRLPEMDAKDFFKRTPIGTLVTIY